MRRFAELYRAIDATTSTNEKVAVMRAYLAGADPADAAWALYLLTGRSRRRYVTSRMLRQCFATVSTLPDWLLEESYAHVGDTAETVALLLPHSSLERGPGGRPSRSDSAAEPVALSTWMEERIPPLKEVDEEERRRRLLGWWTELDPFEVYVLNKVLTGGFRVGVSARLVVRAVAAAFDLPEDVVTHRMTGTWHPSAAFFEDLVSASPEEMPPSRPYPFFLAHPLEAGDLEESELGRYSAEWKYDGIRAQVIRRSGEVYVWSRGEELVTDQFPEIREAAAGLPDGTVIDGEIVAWDGEAPLSFNHLQRRLGRKNVTRAQLEETPVHLIAYDCLEAGGADIRGEPLAERRRRLAGMLPQMSRTFSMSQEVAFEGFDDLERLRAGARQRGVEGLMLKDRRSVYGVGRRKGPWWKYKAEPFTLDAVLIYAQAGSGKRANLFTDYTFGVWRQEELVPIAKAYSGLSNEEIARLDRWIRRNTVEKYGPARAVKPEQVFEIAFEGIARSKRHKSGLAVRFPRIIRWRDDKPAAEADTLERAHALVPDR
jgi:DNA ligase-1